MIPLIIKVAELLTFLKQNGGEKKDQKGGHLQLVHFAKQGQVTVPMHGGDVPKGTLTPF